MTSWQLIFLQSRVNNGAYDGDYLPAQNWDWPRRTWFQERLYYLRAGRRHRTENIRKPKEWIEERRRQRGENAQAEARTELC